MKRIFTLTVLCFVASLSLQAQNRLVFIEEFTQASCPPCEATTPALNEVLIANADKVVQIRYHTSWPGVDPMNADNQPDVQARVDYYGVSGVPNLRIDGPVATGAGNQLVTPAEIDARYAVPSPIEMTLTHDYNDDNSQITVTVEVTNSGADAYSVAANRLRVAVVEEEISWPFRPGSTSIQVFEAVMKSFVTGVQGMAIPEIGAGETWSETWTVDVPSTWYALAELAMVAWVQDDNTRAVINSAESHPVPLKGDYLDVAGENKVATQTFCDATVVPTVGISNGGSIEITEAEVSVFLDGNQLGTETYTGSIAPGASVDFELTEIPTTPGGSEYSFEVISANGQADDVNRLNGITGLKFVGIFGEFSELDETFEDKAFSDEGDFIVDSPNDLSFVTVLPSSFGADIPPLGSNSNNAVIIDFWTWSIVGEQGFMYFGELDFTDRVGVNMTFDHAGGQYQNSRDRVSVEVSTDCGATWSEVWTAAGADLATDGNVNTARFRPTPATQWKTAEIDLSAYDGSANLSMRFVATSDYGNSAFLDNINLSATPVSTYDVVDETLATIAPNPVSDRATIKMQLDAASDVVLQVTDLSGRLVGQQNYGLQSGVTTLSYDVTTLDNGIYIFNIVAGDTVSPHRVSVMK